MTTNDNDNQEALENLKNEMRKMALQTKNMAEYLKKQKDEVESEEKTSLEEWQPIQTQYVSSYLEKCISRMNLHEESARYYTRRHYIIVIPATAMGVITSTAAFSQWSNNVLCGQTSWVMLLVGGMMALTTLLHNLSEFVFAYKDKARQHQQSYINFSRLVKRISNEYNNPVQEHKPYRQFIESISEDYDRYTEHALMVPASVDKMLLNRWIRNNEITKEQEQEEIDEHRNSETRIVEQSTVNTAIDAATIHSTNAAIKTIAEKMDGNQNMEVVDNSQKLRRISLIPHENNIVHDFKTHNSLNKLKKGQESTYDAETDAAAARYGVSSGLTSRRQSLLESNTSRRPSGTTKNTNSGTESRRPSLVELMQKRRQLAANVLDEEPESDQQRHSVVKFDIEPTQRKSEPLATGAAALFAQRSSVLQKAAAKFQYNNSKNIPFESMIELNAISSTSSSTGSHSPPNIAMTPTKYLPTFVTVDSTPDELEKGHILVNNRRRYHHHHEIKPEEKDNPDEDLAEEEHLEAEKEPKGKRRKKKRIDTTVSKQILPAPEARDSQFAALKAKIDFEKRISAPRRLSTATAEDLDEEDVTPDDVGSHVFGQVKYDSLAPADIQDTHTAAQSFNETI